MPAAALLTFADLVRDQQRVEICCCFRPCQRSAILIPEQAAGMFGAETSIVAAGRAVVCSACGARGREKMVTVRPVVADFYDRRWAWARHDKGYAPLPGDEKWLALPRA